MTKFLNEVKLCGNLTRDPEIRSVGANGTTLAKFAIAINRKWGKEPDKREEVTFIECEAWGACADSLSNYAKGNGVYVEGRLKFEQWEEKDSGKKRSALKVTAFLIAPPLEWDEKDKPKDDTPRPNLDSGTKKRGGVAPMDDSDIPFAMDPI